MSNCGRVDSYIHGDPFIGTRRYPALRINCAQIRLSIPDSRTEITRTPQSLGSAQNSQLLRSERGEGEEAS